MVAGRSAVISCSKTAQEISSTTRTQTDDPFSGAAMNRVDLSLCRSLRLCRSGSARALSTLRQMRRRRIASIPTSETSGVHDMRRLVRSLFRSESG